MNWSKVLRGTGSAIALLACASNGTTDDVGLETIEQPAQNNGHKPRRCASDAACAATEFCDSIGLCHPRKAVGRACEPEAEADCFSDGCRVCASGSCVDGFCCNQACNGSCSACSAALTGAPNGTCAPVVAGTDPRDACEADSDYPEACGADGQCDGLGSCRAAALPGTQCSDTTCSAGQLGEFACDGSGRCVESSSSCGPNPSDFVQLSAASVHTCGVRRNGSVACWGYSPFFWGAEEPVGQTFTMIGAGTEHTIAIRTDGTLAFWGNDQNGLGYYLPGGTFRSIAAGYAHDCAFRTDGTLVCWGWNGAGQTDVPPGVFTQVGVGTTHTCALKTDGTIECWGSNDFGEATPPSGTFTAVSARGQQGCGLRPDGHVECWGRGPDLQDWVPPPPDTFLSVQCRGVAACAMRPDRSITCWGHGSPESMAPSGPFTSYAIGDYHSCAIRVDNSIACWGQNGFGQSDPP
jgi:hypothetical protein